MRELALGQTEGGSQVLSEEGSLANNFQNSLVNGLLVSDTGLRDSSFFLSET